MAIAPELNLARADCAKRIEVATQHLRTPAPQSKLYYTVLYYNIP